MNTILPPEKQFRRGLAFVFLGLGVLAMYLGVMPTGIIGAVCLLLPLALILEPLGERIPPERITRAGCWPPTCTANSEPPN